MQKDQPVSISNELKQHIARLSNWCVFVNQMVQRREALGMTHKDLSEESGIAVDVIKDIENHLYFPSDEERSLLRLALDF